MPEDIDLSTVEVTRFEPLRHEKFSARPWDGPAEPPVVELELVRTLAQPSGGQEGGRTPFSLFFDGPAGVALTQGTYTLTHPRTGEMALFLVPVARREDRVQLQAVLN